MCGFDTSSAILHGFYRIRFFSVLLTLVTTTLVSNTKVAGHGASAIQRITEASRFHGMRGSLEVATKQKQFLNSNEILMGHSGDPWGTYNESEDVRNPRLRLQTSLNAVRTRNSSRSEKSSKRRPRRSVIHLYNMVVCATGCNPMAYKGYGCYCGFLGSGTAVDGIDQCCRMHDRCYEATECPGFLEYFVPYYWKCYRGYRPICAVEHGKWGGSGSCAQRLCECDRALSECLRRFPCPRSKAVCTTSPWRLIQNVFMII